MIEDNMQQRVLELTGNTPEVNLKLSNLRYQNLMYDSRQYTDVVTFWIKEFQAIYFEIEIKREQLQILPVNRWKSFPINADFEST